MVILFLLIAVYIAVFVVLVNRGHEWEWEDEYGFMYSTNELRDDICGVIFAPLGAFVQLFGVVRLSQPQRSLH